MLTLPNRFAAIVLPTLICVSACRDDRPVVYCSVDEAFARHILDLYEQKNHIKIDVVFDSEAGKTTGLVQRIRAEVNRPRADVFWSGELINTIVLAREGLLAPYASPSALDLPKEYVDPQHHWSANAVRFRVLAFDPKRSSVESLPSRWEQLAEPKWASGLALANPLFGTTRAHVAAMFALWGPDRGRAFLNGLDQGGAQIVDGNSVAVRKVISGEADWAMTDTDDVYAANRHGAGLELRYLDMGDGGTVGAPCSVALLRGSRHAYEAKRLIDFLISAEVEELLYHSTSGNIPVRAFLRSKLGCTLPPITATSFVEMADALDGSVQAVREILIR